MDAETRQFKFLFWIDQSVKNDMKQDNRCDSTVVRSEGLTMPVDGDI